MGLLETIAAAASKMIIEKVLSTSTAGKPKDIKTGVEQAIQGHLREVANWTEKVHSFGIRSTNPILTD